MFIPLKNRVLVKEILKRIYLIVFVNKCGYGLSLQPKHKLCFGINFSKKFSFFFLSNLSIPYIWPLLISSSFITTNHHAPLVTSPHALHHHLHSFSSFQRKHMGPALLSCLQYLKIPFDKALNSSLVDGWHSRFSLQSNILIIIKFTSLNSPLVPLGKLKLILCHLFFVSYMNN